MRLAPCRFLPASVAAAAALVLAGTASAATPISVDAIDLLGGRTALTASTAVHRSCFAKLLSASDAGVAVTEVRTTVEGYVDARIHGAPTGEDWDLAVFDGATGRLVGASAAFGGNEVVSAPVPAGATLTVQACRYGGGTDPVDLSVGETVVSGDLPAPEKQSLITIPVRRQSDVNELEAAGIDLNETGTKAGIDAVLHGAQDAATLTRLGFSYRTKVADLAVADLKAQRADATGSVAPSDLPSTRSSYRHLADYQQDLKDLVAAHPKEVRPIVLPHRSVEGRTIEGVEIAADVARTDDGRPTVFQLGLHHVREWSSGEVTMEYALELFKSTTADDAARKRRLLAGERTFAFPVINPDGLEATQVAGDYVPADDANAEVPGEGGLGAGTGPAVAGQGSYRRKNCAHDPNGNAPAGAPCSLQAGVDLNRNYGAFWGGPGESSTWTNQTFRGPSPFSEPETQNVHEFTSRHQVMVMNSNHNYAGDVLYQPGFNGADEPGFPKGTIPPYQPAMKALSDKIAAGAGYASFVSYKLYDVTGATEDWNYFAQGAFGYTTEVGYGNFHPNYQDAVIDQYLGTVAGPYDVANSHAPSKGLRESMLITGEAALDPAQHSQITGTAPAGRVLRLTKDFKTSTSNVESDAGGSPGPPILIPEHLESTLTVPASGSYSWAVNPSTRPLPLLAGRTEAWTLTCEDAAGRVYDTRQVTVAIGETSKQDFTCAPPAAAAPATAAPAAAAPSAPVQPVAPSASEGGPTQTAAGLLILRPKFSAKRTTRLGGLALYLRVTGGAVRDVRATIRDARGRLLLSGVRSALPASGRVALRRRALLRPGPVRVKVTALTSAGKRITVSRPSRLVR